jgi:hypothetical protein
MTLRQVKNLFNNIATAHKEINDFGFGEIWEIEEKTNKNIKYPIMFVTPVQTEHQENVNDRTFTVLIFDMVRKDYDNQVNAWSSTEQILEDVIEILRKESDEYEVVGNPILIPFKEDFSDWATGYRADIVLRTNKTVTHCNIPADSFISPSASKYYVTIKDQNGNTVKTVKPGETYSVIVATGIDSDLTATSTVIVIDNL